MNIGGGMPGRLWRSAVALTALLLMAGCAALNGALPSGVVVERVDSAEAAITQVHVRVTGEETVVEGELRPIKEVRLRPPGVVVVEILDSSGASLARASADYHRLGSPVKPLQRYGYSVVIPAWLPEAGVVRITHRAVP